MSDTNRPHPVYDVLPPADAPVQRPLRRHRPRRRASREVVRRLGGRAALVCALGLASLAVLAWQDARRLPQPASGLDPYSRAFRVVPTLGPAPGTAGVVYPYSVIPGGARSRAELVEAIARDRVVSTHMAGFAPERAVPVHASSARRVHVSYRVGDRVYWTRRTVTIPEGELLLTDGTNEVRARCGNRVADRIVGETSPLEPSEIVLDTPVLRADDPANAPVMRPLQAYGILASGGGLPPPVDAPFGGGFGGGFAGLPPYYGGGGHGTSDLPPSGGRGDDPGRPGEPPVDPPVNPPPVNPPPVNPPPVNPPPVNPPPKEPPPVDPPPVEVPEPGTLALLGAGALALAVTRRVRRP